MYRDLRDISVDNKKIVSQNYYLKDGRRIDFVQSLKEHQSVVVVSPSVLSSARE